MCKQGCVQSTTNSTGVDRCTVLQLTTLLNTGKYTITSNTTKQPDDLLLGVSDICPCTQKIATSIQQAMTPMAEKMIQQRYQQLNHQKDHLQ